MKYILIVLLSLSLYSADNIQSNNEEIKWSSNYNMARYRATKEDKKVLVFISAKDSPYSDIMREDVFKHKDVVYLVNKYFIAVELSLGLDRIPVGIKVFSAPAVYFMTNKGKEVCRHIVGQVGVKKMIQMLEDAQNACKVIIK